MEILDLDTGYTFSFSHNKPELAFAYVIAEKNKLLSRFAHDASKIKVNVTTGKYGYHCGNMSIPFSSME